MHLHLFSIKSYRKPTNQLTICKLTATTMSDRCNPPIIHIFIFHTSAVFWFKYYICYWIILNLVTLPRAWHIIKLTNSFHPPLTTNLTIKDNEIIKHECIMSAWFLYYKTFGWLSSRNSEIWEELIFNHTVYTWFISIKHTT